MRLGSGVAVAVARLAAAAPIQLLAQKLPYAAGERKKEKKNKTHMVLHIIP